MKSIAKSLLMALVVTTVANAQEPLEFDVASVKINHNPPRVPTAVSVRESLSHGRLTLKAVTLSNLIEQAYSVRREDIVKCPNWCDSDWFEVIAQAEDPNVTPQQVQTMIQGLLADRFQLGLHRERQERSGYVLVVSKNGPKLKTSKEGSALSVTRKGYVWIFQKLPIAGLVNFVAASAKQPVVDTTGLTGFFDITLDLTPSENDSSQGRGGIPPADPGGFSILATAIEDQLSSIRCASFSSVCFPNVPVPRIMRETVKPV
jgi:uncharacterized protein (TIGR03435 family)